MLIVVTILGILLSIASPAYDNYKKEHDFARTRQNLLAIQTAIDRFYIINNRFPDSLEEIAMEDVTDAWGSAFRYTNVSNYQKKTSEDKIRRDKKLKPVNSDYDLYSMGQDLQSKPSFTASVSLDDIVRCNNGRFIGYARDY